MQKVLVTDTANNQKKIFSQKSTPIFTSNNNYKSNNKYNSNTNYNTNTSNAISSKLAIKEIK